ncbi:MAG: hypothetical protein ABI301_01375 [Jatrophihabitantaceae bacterium]
MGGTGLRWTQAVTRLGGRDDIASASAAELEQRYAEPHRSYHTLAHVEAVLRDAAWLEDRLGLDADERALVDIAACAHDVVYAGRSGEDERASASWARRRLAECGVAEQHVETVARLVLATIDHRATDGDHPAAVLLDADLAVLGSSAGDYARYVLAVRREYAAVPADQWRIGRAAVLTGLLAHPQLFHSAPARSRWADAARRNLTAELAALTG